MQLSKSVELRSVSNQIDVLVVENDLAMAQISLHGGHMLSFRPKSDNRERLWLSQDAVLDGTKAIRGGIPICWPWFGDYLNKDHLGKDLPAHGYVRTKQWHVVDCVDFDATTLITLKPETAADQGLDGDADLRLTVSIGNALTVELTTKNIGAKAFEFGGALHSYFNIEDITQTQLHGLSGDYLDKTQSLFDKSFANKSSADKSSIHKRSPHQITPEKYTFEKETDNIHLSLEQHFTISTTNFSIDVVSKGHDSIVVWNPWIEKSAAMTDMSAGGYQSMLCVESAITQGITLAPNEQHSLIQTIQ